MGGAPNLPAFSASTEKPQLSVVMPVHNALPYLDQAVESILDQTFADFEFVILDDASTDGSTQRLRDWASKDSRIRLIEVEHNLGPVLSSERVARAAIAPFVARMDADDVSHADRLRQQMEVIHENPGVGLVACLSDLMDSSGRRIRGPDLWRLARRSSMIPFPHGAIFYRRELFDRVGGYRSEAEFWEDQDLVTRMAALAKIMVIPQALYSVRQTAVSTRSIAGRERQERAIDAMYRSLAEPGAGTAGNRGDAGDEKIDPRVFLSLGSVTLWSGGRPRLFTRLLRHGKLSRNMRTLTALGWTAWASASPASLRGVLKMGGRVRSMIARARLDVSGPILWSPRSQPRRVDERRNGIKSASGSQKADCSMVPAGTPLPSEAATRTVRSGKVSD